MSEVPPGFLRLPLELRQSIYQSCCDTTPAPNLLRVNRLIRGEAIHFIRTRLHTFCFHISKEGAGFDELAQWCFKIKGHKGEKNKVKQLILKIYPPNPDKPIEMFQIWDHLQDFCKDLTTYPRIPGLKVIFAEKDSARWVTDGILHSSFELENCYREDDIYGHDVGQILLAFSHLIKNVRKPAIVLPNSVASAIGSAEEVQEEIIQVEHLMTGKWSNEDIRTEYEDLENLIRLRRSWIKYHTGHKSKAVFERMFGEVATLDWQSLKNFENDYPYMDSLGQGQVPRYRSACRNEYCGCEDSYCEVAMPPADLDYEDEEQCSPALSSLTPAYRDTSVKLAYSRPFKLFLFSAVLFIPIAIILALPTRLVARVSAIAGQIKPFGSSTIRPPAKPLTTAAMAPQSFKKPPQAPPLFTGTPTSILDDTKRLIDKSRALQDKVVADVKPEDATFENTVLPMAHDENTMGLETRIIGFYQSVSTNQDLRNASTEAEKQMDDFSIESSMREDVFKVVDAAFQTAKKGDGKLDPESMRLLEKERKSYIRNGLGLEAGPKRDRFKEIKKRLSQLSIVFQKNLNEENGGLWFTPEELDGVPEDVLSGLTKGEGDDEGKLKLSFKYPDLFPTLKYATNAETRKQVFIQNENKLNQNVPIFKESIVLRDEAARLLGYPNHAAFKIEDKMAKTPKTVDDFLGDLRSRLTEGGKNELKDLTALKESDTKSSDGHYFLWDNRFYDRLMLEKDYSLDQQKIAEYFPLQTSIRGMLEIFETLFGLVFVEITGEDRVSISPSGEGDDIVWHPDVQMFSVWDDEGEGGGFVGYLYLDLHPREGKYGHAANFNIQPGYIDEKGNRHYPCTALVCNFSKPTPKKPSLLKHEEVVTLFHELGHGIHDLVSKTIYSRFHGTSTVRDFVEAPSQMLENWCWTPSQLKALSHHYSSLSPEYEAAWREQSKEGQSATKPNEQLPDKMINDLIKTKHVNDALANLRQLHFGIFDMTVHEPKSHADIEGLKVSELYNRLRKDIVGIDGPEVLGEGDAWGHGEATFGHLIGGYDAGYYGYLSSQVYSADMFYSVFAKDPMNATEGRRYRHTVLEKGGRQDEMETLKEFLGREPSTEAFYRELGLS